MKLLIFKQANLVGEDEDKNNSHQLSPRNQVHQEIISVKVCGPKILVISVSERPRLSVLGLEAAVSSPLKRNAFYTDSFDERTIHNM